MTELCMVQNPCSVWWTLIIPINAHHNFGMWYSKIGSPSADFNCKKLAGVFYSHIYCNFRCLNWCNGQFN